jgi:hypothetical protein
MYAGAVSTGMSLGIALWKSGPLSWFMVWQQASSLSLQRGLLAGAFELEDPHHICIQYNTGFGQTIELIGWIYETLASYDSSLYL